MQTLVIKKAWDELTKTWSDSESEWELLVSKYEHPRRHYHTLKHIGEMFGYLSAFYQNRIPDPVSFALFYHDYEYNPLRNDNESKSAEKVLSTLQKHGYDTYIIEEAKSLILYTALHPEGELNENALAFLDADLSILGAVAARYEAYRNAVRKEFNVYPDFLYKRGRKKFLQSILNRKQIFQTPFFHEKLEAQAQINVLKELNQMS